MANGQNLQAVLDLAANIGRNLQKDTTVPVTPSDQPAVVEAVIDAVKQNPVTKNALNLESLGTSRIFVAALVGLGAQVIRPFGVQLAPEDYDTWIDAISAAVTIAGLVSVIYGRVFGASLPPIRWPWSK